MKGRHRAVRRGRPHYRILRGGLVSVVLVGVLALGLFSRSRVTFSHFCIPHFNIDLLLKFDILLILG